MVGFPPAALELRSWAYLGWPPQRQWNSGWWWIGIASSGFGEPETSQLEPVSKQFQHPQIRSLTSCAGRWMYLYRPSG